jgi:Na+/H+-dicarboxylate symporter
MNLALQRRRLVIAMSVTVVALVVAMAAVVATFGFHQPWGMWLFVGAILAGFASHGWLMLGVLREKSAP